MSNRHLARSIILQTLYEWDFNNRITPVVEDILERDIEEFAPELEKDVFAHELLNTVLAKQQDLDLIIEKAAPAWPINRIAVIDRNILRIGLAELLFGDRSEVPPKVAINEAIELGKAFGGDNSGRFINGVLGAVYKELGEPGKDDRSKSKTQANQDPSTFPLERLGGAVVYTKHEGSIYLALVHDIFGHWTLSKGHINESETDEVGTVRKIKEEINLPIEVKAKLGENEYIATHPENGKTRKRVTYFLAEAPFAEMQLEEGKGGLDDAKWFKATEITALNIYDDILPIITKGITLLLEGI